VSGEALTPDEHEAMRLSAALANVVRRIIGDGPQAEHDWNEAAQRIHAVQHMVMAQAAARCYPERYRLLGGTVAATAPQSASARAAPPVTSPEDTGPENAPEGAVRG
jgi:hypothetical protein